MNKKVSLFILLTVCFSCKSDMAVPADIELKKVKSFYIGLFEVDVYQIQNKEIPTLIELAGFPSYKNYFDKDFKKSEWSIIGSESETRDSFLLFLNSRKSGTSKANIIWIDTLIENFKNNGDDLYISGIYKVFKMNQVEFMNRYYFYYILDKKNRQLIRFSEQSDLF